MTDRRQADDALENMARSFQDWYAVYPHKRDRGHAAKAWKALRPGPDLIEEMIAAVLKQIEHRNHCIAKGEWVPDWPYPATWIRGERWADEIPEPAKASDQNCDRCRADVSGRGMGVRYGSVLLCYKCYSRIPRQEPERPRRELPEGLRPLVELYGRK